MTPVVAREEEQKRTIQVVEAEGVPAGQGRQILVVAAADVDGQQHWQQTLEKEEEDHQIRQRTGWWQEQGLQLQYTKLWSPSCVVFFS